MSRRGQELDRLAELEEERRFLLRSLDDLDREHGEGLERWHTDTGAPLAERSERVGETVFYYVHDERPMLEALRGRETLAYLHRRANLEDVFVKLTGRDLRDG